jgi:steroid 5-alpha reductase family enzyme
VTLGLAYGLAAAAGAVLVAMLALWLVSIPLKDASIVDIFWGPGFVVAGFAAAAASDGAPARRWLALALVSLWGLRLGAYLLWRKRGHGEDPRYTALVEHLKPRPRHVVTLTRVFRLQAGVMLVVALPVIVCVSLPAPAALGPAAYAGAALFLVGFAFEAVGDWQLARFKADPANRGRVMDRGLWRYTRHPNYFGDSCVWFGLWLVACDHWIGAATIVSPLLMTWFLVRVTGKALLERRLKRANPAYADYIRRTSGFFPWPPRRGTMG